MEYHLGPPGFRISMRYAPHLTAFEVYMTYIDSRGRRFGFEIEMAEQVGELPIPALIRHKEYKLGESIPHSFTIAPEETYDLARELHHFGPFKPDKSELDLEGEQIGWLRGIVEKVIDFKLSP